MMSKNSLQDTIKGLANTVLCAGVLSLFYLFGDILATHLALPVSPALYGLLLLFCSLFVNSTYAQWITQAAQPLLKHMVFFFIPAVLSVMLFSELVLTHVAILFLAVVITTVVSLMIATWLMTQFMTGDTSD